MTENRVAELDRHLVEQLVQIVGTAAFRAFELTGVQSLNNKVLQLVCRDTGERYAVRLASDRGKHHMGVAGDEEEAIARAASKAGIGPKRVHYNANSGLMLTEWIDQAAPLESEAIRQPDILQHAIALTRQLHAIDADKTLPGGRTIFERIAHIERSVATLMPGDLIDARHRRRLDALAATAPRRRCLTHNDLWPNNILRDDTRLWLTDWEFSGIGDGMYDLATLSISAGLDAAADARLLADYDDSAGDLDWLTAMKWVVCYFEAVWSANMALLSASAPDAKGQPFDFRAHSERMIARLDA